MAKTVTILDSKTLPSIEEARRGKSDRFVTYKTEDGRNGMVRLPEETFAEDALKKAIEADLKKADAIIGKTLTL